MAKTNWWWEDLTKIKNYLFDQHSQDSYQRFLKLLQEDDEAVEIIDLRNNNTREWWRLESNLIEGGFIIHCQDITQSHEKERKFKQDYVTYSRFF